MTSRDKAGKEQAEIRETRLHSCNLCYVAGWVLHTCTYYGILARTRSGLPSVNHMLPECFRGNGNAVLRCSTGSHHTPYIDMSHHITSYHESVHANQMYWALTSLKFAEGYAKSEAEALALLSASYNISFGSEQGITIYNTVQSSPVQHSTHIRSKTQDKHRDTSHLQLNTPIHSPSR